MDKMIRNALESAVKKALDEVGLETFKRTSLFMTNHIAESNAKAAA